MRGDLEPAGSAGRTGRGGRRLAPRALQDRHLLSLSPGAAGTWTAPNPRPVPLTLIGVSPAGALTSPGARERNAGVRTASRPPGTTERRGLAEQPRHGRYRRRSCRRVPARRRPRVEHERGRGHQQRGRPGWCQRGTGRPTAGTCLWGAAPGIWVASWPRSRRTPEWGRPGPQLPGLVPSQPGGCRRSPVPAHSARQRWHSCTGCWCVSPRGRSGGAARGCGSPALSSMTWPSRPPPTCWSSSDATARRAAGRIRNFTSRARHSWVARP